MRILQMQVNALMRLCTAEEESDRAAARSEVLRLLNRHSRLRSDPEYLIRELLLELGTPDHLLGHPYVVQAILLVIRDRNYISSITFSLYPQLAAMFDTTPSRIERAIRNLVEITWTKGNLEALTRCFGYTVSPDQGKPTNAVFIARIANIVSQQLRQAA